MPNAIKVAIIYPASLLTKLLNKPTPTGATKRKQSSANHVVLLPFMTLSKYLTLVPIAIRLQLRKKMKRKLWLLRGSFLSASTEKKLAKSFQSGLKAFGLLLTTCKNALLAERLTACMPPIGPTILPATPNTRANTALNARKLIAMAILIPRSIGTPPKEKSAISLMTSSFYQRTSKMLI